MNKINYPEKIAHCKSEATRLYNHFVGWRMLFNVFTLFNALMCVFFIFAHQPIWCALWGAFLGVTLYMARTSQRDAFFFRQEWLNCANDWEKLWKIDKT